MNLSDTVRFASLDVALLSCRCKYSMYSDTHLPHQRVVVRVPPELKNSMLYSGIFM